MRNSQKRRYYEYLSHQIGREDSLVNNRLTWLLTTQGLLFAAFALVLEKDGAQLLKNELIKVLPLVGIVLSILCLLGVVGAIVTIRGLQKRWRKLDYDFAPPPCGVGCAWGFGFIPSLGLPLSFLYAWLDICFDMVPVF
jgi:hypothetical protein